VLVAVVAAIAASSAFEASAPTSSPERSIGQVTISGPAPASSAAAITTIPANNARNPSWTTLRGEAVGNSLGTPTAASSSVIDNGSSRTPVAIADRPSATDRNSGIVKNSPAWSRYWKKNEVGPPRSVALVRIFGLISGARPLASRRFSHHMNATSTITPASSSQIEGDRPTCRASSGTGRRQA
jgi:hypothetical protein